MAQIKIGNLVQERKCLSQFLHWTVYIDFAGNEVYFNDYTLLLLSKSLKSVINICVTWYVDCFGVLKVQFKNYMLKSFTDSLHPWLPGVFQPFFKHTRNLKKKNLSSLFFHIDMTPPSMTYSD